MRLIFLGPPGAGKGTHARILSGKNKIPQLAAGDLLRKHIREGSELGKRAKAIIEKGELVPDELVNELMIGQLENPEAAKGFILDGYPRTLGQAKALDGFLSKEKKPLHSALYFKTSEKVIVDRLSGRRVCPKCGANFHIRNIPPRAAGKCDECRSDLIQRQDDRPETIKHRLEVYEKETAPLLDHYKKQGLLDEVPGDYEVPELQEVLETVFERRCREAA